MSYNPAYAAMYRKKNHERLGAQCRASKQKRREYYRGLARDWRVRNLESVRRKDRDRYVLERERRIAYSKAYYAKNKESISNRDKIARAAWSSEKKESKKLAIKEWRLRAKRLGTLKRRDRREYRNKVRATVRGKLDHRMSSAVRAMLKTKNGRSWKNLVGYSAQDLRLHLESKFTKGMTWTKFQRGLIQIDHVIPKAKWNYQSPEDLQFRQCWALENLQPMWSPENLAKRDKISVPTQIPIGI